MPPFQIVHESRQHPDHLSARLQRSRSQSPHRPEPAPSVHNRDPVLRQDPSQARRRVQIDLRRPVARSAVHAHAINHEFSAYLTGPMIGACTSSSSKRASNPSSSTPSSKPPPSTPRTAPKNPASPASISSSSRTTPPDSSSTKSIETLPPPPNISRQQRKKRQKKK